MCAEAKHSTKKKLHLFMIHPFLLLLTGSSNTLHNPQTQSLHDSSILPPHRQLQYFTQPTNPILCQLKCLIQLRNRRGFSFQILWNYQKFGECFQKLSQKINQFYYTMGGKKKKSKNPKISQFLGVLKKKQNKICPGKIL